MSTSKSLQTPTIIGITGSTIRVAHPDISTYTRTFLAAPIAASGTAMTVYDNNSFSDDDWMIVGSVGDSETESTDVNGAVTRGQSITVTNYLTFGHELDSQITKIFERGVKIYGAATNGGAGTLIASIDAITASGRQLADAVMIHWNRPYTEITLISTDTAYAYYYAVFTDGTTSSSASDYIPSTGYTSSQVEYFIQQALDLTGAEIGEKIKREMCIRWANDAQNAITEFTYQDPRTNALIQKDWDFEIADDITSITGVTGCNKYSLSSLSMKYPYNKGVISVQIGTETPFDKTDIDTMNRHLENQPYTEVATQATAGDTTLVVDSLVEFEDDGTLNVAGQSITYTGVSGTTTFTGIPASGTGAITATIAVDTGVWQNNENGLPEEYTVFKNYLILDTPLEDDYSGWPFHIKYFKTLTALTQASDTTVVTFTNAFQFFIASRIEQRRQNTEKADMYMSKFNKIVLDNALHHKVTSTDGQEYYTFSDPITYLLD